MWIIVRYSVGFLRATTLHVLTACEQVLSAVDPASRLQWLVAHTQQVLAWLLAWGIALFGKLSWSLLATVSFLTLLAALVLTVAHARASRERRRLARSLRRARARLADADVVLVTNAEPGEWLNKMLVQYWHSFVHPKLLNTMLRSVQGKLDEVVDQGVLSLWVEKFHLGLAPPVLSNWKAYAHRDGSRGLARLEVDVHFATDQADIELKGQGNMVGLAQVIISGLAVEGKLAMYPVANQRLLVFGFKGSPEVSLDYKIFIGANETHKLNIGAVLPIRSIVENLFKDLMIEPNRRCVGLELQDLNRDPVVGSTAVRVKGVSGVRPTQGRRLQVDVTCKDWSRTAQTSFDGPDAAIDEAFVITMADKAYTIDVVLRDRGRSEPLGRARLEVNFLSDGSTAFWGSGLDGSPVARRVAPFESWEVALAVMAPDEEGRPRVTRGAVHLAATQQGWRFAQRAPPEFVCYRSLGPRTLLLLVVEAEGLPKHVASAYASVTYGPLRVDTHKCENTQRPVWNAWMKVEESPNPGLRRVKVQIRNATRGVKSDEPLGHAWLALDAVHECHPLDQWLDLEGPAKGGRVHLVAEVRPGRADQVPLPAYHNRSGTEVLEVGVRMARSLADRASIFRPRVNAFAIVSYGLERRRTDYVRDSVSPVWDQTYTFPFEEGRLLQVEIWNRTHVGFARSLASLEYMGTLLLNPSLLSTGVLFEQWLPLEGVHNGEVLLRCRRHAPPADRLVPATAGGLDHQRRHVETEAAMREAWDKERLARAAEAQDKLYKKSVLREDEAAEVLRRAEERGAERSVAAAEARGAAGQAGASGRVRGWVDLGWQEEMAGELYGGGTSASAETRGGDAGAAPGAGPRVLRPWEVHGDVWDVRKRVAEASEREAALWRELQEERPRRRELESRESARLAAEAARARKGRGVLRRLMGRGKPRAAQVPTVPGDPAAPSTEAHTAKSS